MHLAGSIDVLELVGHLCPTVHQLPQVGVELSHTLAFGYGAHNDAEVLGTYALHQTAQAVALLGALNLLRDGDFVAEGSQHQVVAGDADVSRHLGAFGGNRFFGDLHQDRLAHFEHIAEVAHLLKHRFYLEVGQRGGALVAVHGQLEVFVDGVIIGPQVEVVHKALLVASHINEGGVEALHDLAHLAEVDVTYGILATRLLTVELNQALVFGERNLHTLFLLRYNEFFFH